MAAGIMNVISFVTVSPCPQQDISSNESWQRTKRVNFRKNIMLICLYSVPVVDIAMLSEPSLVSGPPPPPTHLLVYSTPLRVWIANYF